MKSISNSELSRLQGVVKSVIAAYERTKYHFMLVTSIRDMKNPLESPQTRALNLRSFSPTQLQEHLAEVNASLDEAIARGHQACNVQIYLVGLIARISQELSQRGLPVSVIDSKSLLMGRMESRRRILEAEFESDSSNIERLSVSEKWKALHKTLRNI
eukprot:c1250_g1_i1.p1 GENE.c1250_g1_i1~~c1250_g1_i1.p1  ORF type:complete len:158 (-),score=26.57 c1250_g1_i1:31-504(-)